MSNLTEVEKFKLEKIFAMDGGYVLDFSNQSFQAFIFNVVKLDIYNSKFEKYGTSKAKRLKALWEIEGNVTVGKLIEEMLLYYQAKTSINNEESTFSTRLFEECLKVAQRLQGKAEVKEASSPITTAEDFLKLEVDEVSVNALKLNGAVISILEERIVEIKKCLNNGASLSVIFLCGSVLEGILLGVATANIVAFNLSNTSPKDQKTGKVRLLHEWSLNNFIDVAFDIGILGLDVKKFSHSLRDFRNYIHPYQQMSSGFRPDNHTAKISWQVLKAAMHDIHEKFN